MIHREEIADKNLWEQFLCQKQISYYPFFQSWEWGEVQRKLGFPIQRLGLYDGKKLIAVCMFVEVRAKRGFYIHLRHGPVVFPFSEDILAAFLDQIITIAKEKGASFVRVSPLIEEKNLPELFWKKFSAIISPIHRIDAEICWILNIFKSEEEILKNMRKTHRYLIKKSQQSNIEIIQTKNVSDIKHFIPIYNELSHRKHFVPHKGISQEFEEFSKGEKEILMLAKYQQKYIAGALIAFVGNMAIYRHSASLEEYKNIPASYLIQWRAILEAKKRGLSWYNFWGVAPLEDKNHPWFGLTLFKTGFGGNLLEFIHARDIPLSYKYYITYLIEYIRKKQKGY